MRNYSILFFIVSKKKIFFFQACKINVRELMMKMKRSIDDGDEDVQKGYNFFSHVHSSIDIAYWYQERIVFIIIHYYGKSRSSIFYINHLWCIMQLIISNAECARSVQYGTVWYKKNNVMSFFFSFLSNIASIKTINVDQFQVSINRHTFFAYKVNYGWVAKAN